MLSEAILRIENQRKEFKQDSNEDGVCQVILQYCREDQEVARVLASTDKTVKDCYKHMEEYARKHKVGSGYYMGPDTTRRVICQFYSIAGGNAAAASAAAPAPVVTKRDNAINILDLL